MSYNLLQVDGDETRIGIRGPASLAGIPMPEDEQIIVLKGEPIESFKDAAGKEQRDLGRTDTIVEVTGLVPERGREAQLNFRLVALSLVGSFTDTEGQNWEVKITLSEKREQVPSSAIVRSSQEVEGPQQGTFDSELRLFLRFVFTSGEEERIIDEPDELQIVFNATDAQWTSIPPQGAARPDLSGGFFAISATHGGEAGQHATVTARIEQ